MAASINSSENTVKKIYQTVIDEVLTNIREAFLDEGYDEQLLHELRQMWESKLNQSRALAQANAEDAAGASSSSSSNHAGEHTTHSHQHNRHHQQTASSTGGNMRLPISQAGPPPTDKEVAQQIMNRNNNNTTSSSSSQQLPASVGSNTSSSRSQTPSPGSVDTKPVLDPATRAAIQALPHYSQSAQQQQQERHKKQQMAGMTGAQLDGHTGINGGGSSSEDEDDDLGAVGSAHGDDDDDDDKTNNDDPSEYEGKEDPDPLNSEDDLSDHSSPGSNSDLFDTENVIVCQYDKITRIKNKWKFHLKDGIMNINGKDYLFSKANGDAEW